MRVEIVCARVSSQSQSHLETAGGTKETYQAEGRGAKETFIKLAKAEKLSGARNKHRSGDSLYRRVLASECTPVVRYYLAGAHRLLPTARSHALR